MREIISPLNRGRVDLDQTQQAVQAAICLYMLRRAAGWACGVKRLLRKTACLRPSGAGSGDSDLASEGSERHEQRRQTSAARASADLCRTLCAQARHGPA